MIPTANPNISHVVVLMLENRSYDHMLGLLSDDPRYEGVRLGSDEFSNRLDRPDGESVVVPVNDTAGPLLQIDPPHSHISVLIQLGLDKLGARTPTMDGFVRAYARKLKALAEGKESDPPIKHWPRIIGLVVVIVALVLFALTRSAPVALLVAAGALLAVVEGLIAWAYGVRRLLPPVEWAVLFTAPAAFIGVATGVSWFAEDRVSGYARVGVVAASLVAMAATAFLIQRARTRAAEPFIEADEAAKIMACMPPDQIPVLAKLARSFATCTRWHSSVPGATWPNRNFVHAGSSDGTVDIEVGFYPNDTIFDRLGDDAWRIYRHADSVAQVMVFDRLWEGERIRRNWRVLEELFEDIDHDRLASYSFIEPSHQGPQSNSQHPSNNDYDSAPPEGQSDFERGEALIAKIYERLRSRPDVFAKTLFVITYDEHGGFYDHVPPDRPVELRHRPRPATLRLIGRSRSQ